MELYILDETLQRSSIVDTFESLIWTERSSSSGDFELVTASTVGSRSRLVVGTRLAIPSSYRVMTIETVDSQTDSEGKALLKITGPSLESVLKDRVAKKTMSNLTVEPKWILVGTPAAIMREIFQTICVDGDLASGDVIPFIATGNPFPADNIAEFAEIISVELEPMSVYDALKQIGDTYNLGFRLIRDPGGSVLYFNVFSGCDRTTAQTILPSVVFSPNLDNLVDVSELDSIEQYKNVAYVFSKNGFEVVYAPGVDASISGFNRRVLLVKSDAEDAAGVGLTTILRQTGIEELSKNRSLFIVDGKVPSSADYPYGLSLNVGITPGSWFGWDTNETWDDAVGYWDDATGVELPPSTNYPFYGSAYNLGDLIELQSLSGVTAYMNISEQIFVSDGEGERSYPTLTFNLSITADSWFAWDSYENWDDAVGYWDDM